MSKATPESDDATVARAIEAYERVIDQWRCFDAPPSDRVVEAIMRALAEQTP